MRPRRAGALRAASRIALRNLALHRRKSLLVGSSLCLGIFALFVGNSLIDTAVDGLRRLFARGYTGDFMVTGRTAFPTTVFADLAGGEEIVPHIPSAREASEAIRGAPGVADVLPLLSGKAAIGVGESVLGAGSVFGADYEAYRAFFPDGLRIALGAPPAPGAAWMLASEETAALVERATGSPLRPGDKVTLSALAESAGSVIREVEVAGIASFARGDARLSRVDLVDADTLRDLLGFASLSDGPQVLTREEAAFAEAFDPEALFEGDGLFGAAGAGAGAGSGAAAADGAEGGPEARTDPAAAPGAAAVEVEPAWQFLLVRMRDGADPAPAMRAARAALDGLGSPARVQGWVEGAGSVARAALSVRLAFSLMIAVVAVVIVLVAMNALAVSVGERTMEIGALRAIGARRAFVRDMIALETLFLSAAAGAAGLALGAAALGALSAAGLPAPNLFFEAVFGGPILRPRASAGAAIGALAWMAGTALLSSIYPTALAARIRPVAAMGEG